MERPLRIALGRGRIAQQAIALLEEIDVIPEEDLLLTRRLVVPARNGRLQLLILRGGDVPTYVRHGAVDLGIVGSDMLLEYGGVGLYELLDLGLGRCRLMSAGRQDQGEQPHGQRLVVASKYARVARRFYARKGVQADVIRLSGTLELAPALGLAEQIVDIVDTGNTLRSNDLRPLELIAPVSARLVVNQAVLKLRSKAVEAVVGPLRDVVRKRSA